MRKLTSGSPAVAVVAMAVSFLSSPSVARPPVVRVTQTPIAGAIPAEIVGANHRWPEDGLGMWDTAEDRPNPTIVDMSQRAGVRVVRYPGGTVANLFDWKRAIGPQDERGCQVNGGFVGQRFAPLDSRYGIDEHQKFVASIGARTEMMMQSTTATPQDAADLVEYMNAPVGTNPGGGVAWANVRAANGHPAPYHVSWWEIGNEPYLSGQRYWRSSDDTVAMREYAFGGTERQVGERLGKGCDHRASVVSDGTAGQRFNVLYPPVVPASQQVRVNGEPWQAVSDLSTAGPDDHVYRFDAPTGTVTFGDGTHGAVPPSGSPVTADYDSGPHAGFVDFYRAMKRVDPSIDICSSWATTGFVDLMGAGQPYDCLGVHEHLSTLDKSGTPEQVYDRLMTSATGMLALLTDLDTAIQHDRGPRDQPYLAVSEYGALLGPGNGFTGMRNSLMAAQWLAELVTGFIQDDVHYAEMSNLNDPNVDQVDNLFGSAPDFVYTARANVLALFSQLAGGRPVGTDITGNPEAPGGYPSLQILGVLQSADHVQVLVLNRDRTNAVTPQFVMEGIDGGQFQVRVSSVSAESFQSYNSPDQPDAVTTTVTNQAVDGGAVNQELPAHSVSLLDISRR